MYLINLETFMDEINYHPGDKFLLVNAFKEFWMAFVFSSVLNRIGKESSSTLILFSVDLKNSPELQIS